MRNQLRFALLLTGLVVMATSCPTVLNRDRAEEIKVFGGQAASASTSFLKGAPVGALDIGNRLEAQVRKNPQIAAFMNRSAPRMQRQLSSVRLQDYKGCDDASPKTDYRDDDRDDIPVNVDGSAFTYTFDNCSKTIGNDRFTVTGSVTLKDSDDSSRTSGYTFAANNFKLVYSTTVDDGKGGTFKAQVSLTLNGTDTVTATPTRGVYTDAQATRLDFSAVAGSDAITANFSTTSNLEYTTDATTIPEPETGVVPSAFGRGYVNSNSKFSYSISTKIGNVSANASSSFNLKLINVFINRDLCPDDVTDSGLTGKDASVVFSDDSNNILTWNIAPATSVQECGTGVWSFNGTPL